jgi:hypothetical protein
MLKYLYQTKKNKIDWWFYYLLICLFI